MTREILIPVRKKEPQVSKIVALYTPFLAFQCSGEAEKAHSDQTVRANSAGISLD